MNFMEKLTSNEKNIRKFLIKKFYSRNDKAHRADHVDEVWHNICDLVERSGKVGYDRKVLFLGVYLHDIMCWRDRDLHNTLAKDFIDNEEYKKYPELGIIDTLNKMELQTVKDMVYWHRSSLAVEDYEPTYPGSLDYVNLIRYADKGAPIFSDWLKRSMDYHRGKPNQIEEVKKHFIEKFSEDGYAWKNDPGYKEAYYKEYVQFQKDLKEFLENN